MRVIVTGSSGLLGRHVVAALLEAGHDVTGVDTVPPADGALRHITADLTDLGAATEVVRDAEAVVHAAAIPRPTGRTARDVFSTNVAATFNIVEAIRLAGVPKLIYASSYSVTGLPFNETPITPAYFPVDTGWSAAPQDAYALSKWLGEEIVAAAVRKGGLSAASIRMPWIQTPETFGRDVVPRRGDAGVAARNLWSYIDARDAGAAFQAAIATPFEGHRRLFISAADTFMIEETEPLVRAAYPETPLKRPLEGVESVFDLNEARALIGFTSRCSWRDY
jgi:nucleoside-diphosphate-sugar epimerase